MNLVCWMQDMMETGINAVKTRNVLTIAFVYRN